MNISLASRIFIGVLSEEREDEPENINDYRTGLP